MFVNHVIEQIHKHEINPSPDWLKPYYGMVLFSKDYDYHAVRRLPCWHLFVQEGLFWDRIVLYNRDTPVELLTRSDDKNLYKAYLAGIEFLKLQFKTNQLLALK